MRKRQKIVLILYSVTVFFFSFLYVPYARYFENGIKTYAGNHFRSTPLWYIQPLWGHVAIDADLIFAQVISITAIASAILLILKQK